MSKIIQDLMQQIIIQVVEEHEPQEEQQQQYVIGTMEEKVFQSFNVKRLRHL